MKKILEKKKHTVEEKLKMPQPSASILTISLKPLWLFIFQKIVKTPPQKKILILLISFKVFCGNCMYKYLESFKQFDVPLPNFRNERTRKRQIGHHPQFAGMWFAKKMYFYHSFKKTFIALVSVGLA